MKDKEDKTIKELEEEKEELIKTQEENSKKKKLEKEIKVLKEGNFMKTVKVTRDGLKVVGDTLINAGGKILKAGQKIGENTLQQIEKQNKAKLKQQENQPPQEDMIDLLKRI